MAATGGAHPIWRRPVLRIALVLVGIAFLAAGAFETREVAQSRNWASAPARIVISERTGAGARRSSLVVAQYELGGVVFQCGHVALGRGNQAKDADRFPIGARATVYYDPNLEGRCALIRSVSPAAMALLAAGAVMFGLGVLAHLKAARRQ